MTDFQAGLHVCIVGAGIAGLACGIALRLEGFKVTILERDETLQAAGGAGLELQPNAVRVLQQLGVYDELYSKSVRTPTLVLKQYDSGTVLHTQYVLEESKKYAAPCLSVHRVHLRQALYDRSTALGVQVMFGMTVGADQIDLHNGHIKLNPKEQGVQSKIFHADLFIGADGANSSLREALVGQKTEWIPHGKVVNRILIDEGLIRAKPELQHLVEEKNCVVWLGPQSQAVTYSMNGTFNIAFTRPWSVDPKLAFFTPRPVDYESFQAELAAEGWNPELRQLIGLGKDSFCWMFFEPRVDDSKTPWRDASGKFCILGDAAHRTLPYLAQGAAIALESAQVLATLLGKAKTAIEVPNLLTIYEAARKERSAHVIRASLKNGRTWQLPNGPLKDERDRQFLNEERTAGYPNLLADPFFQKWLWGFDARQAADEAWQESEHSDSHK